MTFAHVLSAGDSKQGSVTMPLLPAILLLAGFLGEISGENGETHNNLPIFLG